MTSCFSIPPMRCSRPGVPGRTHGRARVAGSRRYGKKPSCSVLNVDLDRRQLRRVGDEPRLRAVGQEPVAQHDHGHHVLGGEPYGLVGDVEAVTGRGRRQHHHRRLAVASIERLHEVGLLGLRRHARRRPGALDVQDDQRQLRRHGEADALALERDPGTARGGDADRPAERGADGRGDGGDLVLGLDGPHAEALVHRELVQDVARRRDRIGAVDDRDLGPLSGRENAPRQGAIAGHRPIESGRHLRGLDRVVLAEDLRRLAEGVTGLQHARVGFGDVLVLREALLDPDQGRLERPRVDPRDQAEREEVLGPVLLFGVEREVLDGLVGEAGHVDLVQAVALGQRRLVERIRRVARLVEVSLVEGLRVDDQEAARLEIAQVHLERGRIHRDETVEAVTRRVDALAPELQLEARDAEERAGRRADLGRKIRQRGEIVARPRGLGRELFAGELHAVAGVAGEPDHCPIQRFTRLLDAGGGSRYLAHLVVSPRSPCAVISREPGTGNSLQRRPPAVVRSHTGRPTVILSDPNGTGKICTPQVAGRTRRAKSA